MSRVEGPILPYPASPQPPASPTALPLRFPPQTPQTPNLLSQTITILDWDDSILPSTYLHSLGYRVDESCPFPQEISKTLTSLESTTIQLLHKANAYGPTLIITNAEAGWVQLSARRFLPHVLSYIYHHNIKVVSARSEFENDFPMPVLWKTAAFSREIARVYHQGAGGVNVVSVGDSWCERLAARAFGECRGGCWVKTVKFVEMCKTEDIERMLHLVKDAWNDLRTYRGCFDVNLRL